MGCTYSKQIHPKIHPLTGKEEDSNINAGSNGQIRKNVFRRMFRFLRKRNNPDAKNQQMMNMTTKENLDSTLNGEIDKRMKPVGEDVIEKDDLEPCPQNLTIEEVRLQEEWRILMNLKGEGLVSKKIGQSRGGLSFEIVQEKEIANCHLKSRLAQLEKRQVHKKNLSEEEIQRKLEKAESRRKKKEQQKLEKLKVKKNEDKPPTEVELRRMKTEEETENQKQKNLEEKKSKNRKDKLLKKRHHAKIINLLNELDFDD